MCCGYQEQVRIALELLLNLLRLIGTAYMNPGTGILPEKTSRRIVLRVMEFPHLYPFFGQTDVGHGLLVDERMISKSSFGI